MEERAWYIVQTYSGMELAAKRNIENRIESMNMGDKIFCVLVPETIEIDKNKKNRAGEPKEIVTHPYPGYVFIDMIVTDDTWFMIRNTPMVTGFLGSSGGGAKPVPLQDEEISPILKICGISTNKGFKGKTGDKVRITSGSFTGFEGVIDDVDLAKEIVKVLINMFGRETIAELSFNEVALV